ncbi:coiled-coil domain-containing protein 62 isoform X1 [Takifugu rubripes]|uniref:coiled-coil domain-containing protein 62 isoform X1 n=1 Tax=Takifugu rubripes TaxID=31033 RepID=UPI001145AA77|nr:coiled-coil domain-containing protein 62 isoform X1 [Takifugu rubripes]
MDEGIAANGNASRFPWSDDTTAEVWHSTPVKTENGCVSRGKPRVVKSLSMSSPPIPAVDLGASSMRPPEGRSGLGTDHIQQATIHCLQFHANDPGGSTIQRQRRELQLLMAELKDRERELNAMAASHHKQIQAWEQDRRRMLTMEQRCRHLDEELQKRNEVIRVLTKRAWVVESREKEVQKELRVAREQLGEFRQKQQSISQKCEDFEEKNQSLNSTVMTLSYKVGSLQVREEELSSMLKLKDKDVVEASGHIIELTVRLRELEALLRESRSRENKLLKDLEEMKRRHREAKQGLSQLKEELQQHLTQSSTQREEIIRLKQELQLLHRDLLLSGEGDSWKDELLELARSKQERTVSELRCLQQVCENQRNDLQLLQLNLERAHDTRRGKVSQGSDGSQGETKCVRLDKRSPSALGLQNTVDADLGGYSTHLMEADVLSSSGSLQQLLEESRQVIMGASEHSGSTPPSLLLNNPSTTDRPRKHHTCHCCHTGTTQRDGGTPPTAVPPPQPDTWTTSP